MRGGGLGSHCFGWQHHSDAEAEMNKFEATVPKVCAPPLCPALAQLCLQEWKRAENAKVRQLKSMVGVHADGVSRFLEVADDGRI